MFRYPLFISIDFDDLFHRLYKHLEFRKKYSAARRQLSPSCLDIPMRHGLSLLNSLEKLH